MIKVDKFCAFLFWGLLGWWEKRRKKSKANEREKILFFSVDGFDQKFEFLA